MTLSEVDEDRHLPQHRRKMLRAVNRLLRPLQREELENEIRSKVEVLRPDVVMVYKGNGVSAPLLEEVTSGGLITVNVFPDYSPHAYGERLAAAMGVYDLVVSTKPFHPANWTSTYGYSNRCVFVPHGYDPSVHYWPDPPTTQRFDVVVAASWRPEYQQLLQAFAREIEGDQLSVAVAGPRWKERWPDRPRDWVVRDGLFGRAYGEWVRAGRMVIAPVNRRVVIDGQRQPGDMDTTRTYELAAAHTFFLHQRTDYVNSIYDEQTEVPCWDTPGELAELVRHYASREPERRAMAAAAHARAVPAYSIRERAREVLRQVEDSLDARESA